jgi:hypothetical protein
MAFVGLPGTEMPANPPKQSRRYVRGVGPGTAQYRRVWPNEWPNGEIRAGVHEVTRHAHDGRDEDRLRPGSGSPNRHDRTGTAATMGGASPRELDASLLAGSQRRMIAGSPSTTDHVADQRQSGIRELARLAFKDRRLWTRMSPMPQAKRASAEIDESAAFIDKGTSHPVRVLVVRSDRLVLALGALVAGESSSAFAASVRVVRSSQSHGGCCENGAELGGGRVVSAAVWGRRVKSMRPEAAGSRSAR